MRNPKDTTITEQLFTWLCDELNKSYNQFMDLYELDSKLSFGLPPKDSDLCETIPKQMWINKLGDTEILRINIESNVLSIQAKCLYNHITKESYINMINFRLEKIQLRTGGFGTKVINTMFELQRKQISLNYDITSVPTKMVVFGYHSIPFQLKNGFKFKWLVPEEDSEASHWNITYKLFKLLLQMNAIQDVNQSIESLDLFSMEAQQVHELMRKQILAYSNRIYNQNMWIKARILDRVGNKCCEDFSFDNKDFCAKVIYKNIRNQIVDDKLVDAGIIPIMWELFYMSRSVLGNEPLNI